MNGLPAPPPAVQVDYWLAKIHGGYKFHESSALRTTQELTQALIINLLSLHNPLKLIALSQLLVY